jgi:predicted HTH domain antitoxin
LRDFESAINSSPATANARNHLILESQEHFPNDVVDASRTCKVVQLYERLSFAVAEGIESSRVMTLTLPDDLLRSTGLTEAELQAEFALALSRVERLTLGQAALLAGLPQLEFQRLLASRDIPLHYGIEAMEKDVQRAKRSRRLDRCLRHVANPQPCRRKQITPAARPVRSDRSSTLGRPGT